MLKATEVAKLLERDHVKKHKGVFTYWVTYHWNCTGTADKLVAHVMEKIPNAVIVDSGNHFHSFVGGAKSGTAQDSFLWVKFTIPEETVPATLNTPQ